MRNTIESHRESVPLMVASTRPILVLAFLSAHLKRIKNTEKNTSKNASQTQPTQHGNSCPSLLVLVRLDVGLEMVCPREARRAVVARIGTLAGVLSAQRKHRFERSL